MKRLTLLVASLFAAASFAADVPISTLPAASVVNPTDVVPIVQDGVTKKAAVSLFPAGASSGSTINIQDEGVPISTAADTINFTGAGVQCTGGGSSTKVCDITGASAGDAGADGSTKGISTFIATDFNAALGVISIDYANGQAANGSTKGFLTAADWASFNAKQPGHANLSGIASLVPVNDDIIQWKGGVPASRSPSQFWADLMALPTLVTPSAATTYTLAATDNGRVVRFSSASPVAVTVPTAFSSYSTKVCRDGTGAVTIAGSATTLNGGPLVLTSQHQCADITAAGSNTFNVAGPRLKKSGTPTANQQAYFVDGDNVAGISVTPSSVQCTNGSGLPVACSNLTDSSVLAAWALISRAAGFDTFAGSPSFSNLNALLTGDDAAGLAASNAFTGQNSFAGASRCLPAAMAANAIDVTKCTNTKSIAANTTFTFSATPSADTSLRLRLTTDATPRIVTLPSFRDRIRNITATTFCQTASTVADYFFEYDGTNWNVTGPTGYVNNDAATTNPGPTNDLDECYGPGSRWKNVNTGVVWTMDSNANGAAVWRRAKAVVATGTLALSTSAIASGACVNNTATATGALTTDGAEATFPDLSATTGYSGVGTLLTLYKSATADTMNIKQCNWTGSSITPSAVTATWSIER